MEIKKIFIKTLHRNVTVTYLWRMKECLNCKKEFEPKKPKAKFCSISCRVAFHRNKKRKIQEAMSQDKPLEEILKDLAGDKSGELMEKIKIHFSVKTSKIVKTENGTEAQFVLSTSKAELEKIADKAKVQPKSLDQKEEPKWTAQQRVPKPPSTLNYLQKIAWIADWKKNNLQ